MRRLVQGSWRSTGATLGLFLLSASFLIGPALGVQEAVVVDFSKVTTTVPEGWELKEKEGKADVTLVQDAMGQALRLRSNSSSFSIEKMIDIDLKQTPYLVWEWQVTRLPKGGDFRSSNTNDQAAQLLVVFTWSMFKKEVIAYIWDTTAPKGTTGNDPSTSYVPFLTIKTVVIQSGEAEVGKWITETRNIAEDYRNLFGDKPEKAVGIRIQINSQHTQSQAEASWRSVIFSPHP